MAQSVCMFLRAFFSARGTAFDGTKCLHVLKLFFVLCFTAHFFSRAPQINLYTLRSVGAFCSMLGSFQEQDHYPSQMK